MIKEKVILTDCDGVLLDWDYSFNQWMKRHGYSINEEARFSYSLQERYTITTEEKRDLVRAFNESATAGFLTPLRDSVKYVTKLYEEHGYVFRVITSFSLERYSVILREQNLRNIFGNAIEKVISLDTGADKDEALEPYKNSECYWIEDKAENALAGEKQGLTSILIAHDHNKEYEDSFKRVQNWKEIYQVVTGLDK